MSDQNGVDCEDLNLSCELSDENSSKDQSMDICEIGEDSENTNTADKIKVNFEADKNSIRSEEKLDKVKLDGEYQVRAVVTDSHSDADVRNTNGCSDITASEHSNDVMNNDCNSNGEGLTEKLDEDFNCKNDIKECSDIDDPVVEKNLGDEKSLLDNLECKLEKVENIKTDVSESKDCVKEELTDNCIKCCSDRLSDTKNEVDKDDKPIMDIHDIKRSEKPAIDIKSEITSEPNLNEDSKILNWNERNSGQSNLSSNTKIGVDLTMKPCATEVKGEVYAIDCDTNDGVDKYKNDQQEINLSDNRVKPSPSPSQPQKSSKSKPPPDNIRPIGRLLYDLGLDLVRQEVYKDLIDIQAAKDDENKLDEKEKGQLLKLTEAHTRLRAKNSAYHLQRLRCASHCKFGSTSENVLVMHREHGHVSSSQPGFHLCCMCEAFRTRFPSQFITHMENVHHMTGKIAKKLLSAVCSFCPYEHKNSVKVEAHAAKCSKKFQLSSNLQPLPSDCDIPIKYRPMATVNHWSRPMGGMQYDSSTISVGMVHGVNPVNNMNSPMVRCPAPASTTSSAVQPSVMEIGGQLYSWGNHRGKPLLTSLRSQMGNVPTTTITAVTSPSMMSATANSSGMMRPMGMQQQHNRTPSQQNLIGRGSSAASNITTQSQQQYNRMNTQQNLINRGTTAVSNTQQNMIGRGSTVASTTRQNLLGSGSAAASTSQQNLISRGSTGISNATTSPQQQRRSNEICEICGMNVENRQALWTHLHATHKLELSRVSMNEQEPCIVCDICKARFWTYQGLARHSLLLHKRNISSGGSGAAGGVTGARSTFRCHLCGASQTVNPLNHLSTHHNITLLDMYHGRQCCMCNRKLRTGRAFEEHMIQEHRDIFANQDVLRTVLQALSTALYLKSEDIQQSRMPNTQTMQQQARQQQQQIQQAAAAAAASMMSRQRFSPQNSIHRGASPASGMNMQPKTSNMLMNDRKSRGNPPVAKPEPIVIPQKPTPDKKTTEEEAKVLNKLYEDYADIGRPISRAMKQKLLHSPGSSKNTGTSPSSDKKTNVMDISSDQPTATDKTDSVPNDGSVNQALDLKLTNSEKQNGVKRCAEDECCESVSTKKLCLDGDANDCSKDNYNKSQIESSAAS